MKGRDDPAENAPSADPPSPRAGPDRRSSRPRRSPQAPVRGVLLAVGAALVLVAPQPVAAGVEEFSTFSVEEQERDDESLIDHLLTRLPHDWRDEWERSPLAIRTAQGCLTSADWLNETELKLRTPLGRRAWLGFALRQSESDRVRYDYKEFSVHVPTRLGTAGWMFRPLHDKASQDMALMWDVGADTSVFQLRASVALEDVFNNFWEFRQSVTGGRSEPYLRRPWEPGLRMVVRRPRVRAEAGGRYLTPSTKRVIGSFAEPERDHIVRLWGTLAWASIELRALGVDWEARSANHQAASGDRALDLSQPEERDFRRQWSIEVAARRPAGRRLTAELRWIYQERAQVRTGSIAPSRFRAVDRVLQVDAVWRARPSLAVRLGALHDRIGVGPAGAAAPFTPGSRTESRAYVGLIARLGRVSLQAVEGIELDHEPYEVWAVHDKGFVQLQAAF